MTVPAVIRDPASPGEKFNDLRRAYLARAFAGVPDLLSCRLALRNPAIAAAALDQVRDIAHRLAGSAAIFGYVELGDAAANVESVVTADLNGLGSIDATIQALDRLLADLV